MVIFDQRLIQTKAYLVSPPVQGPELKSRFTLPDATLLFSESQNLYAFIKESSCTGRMIRCVGRNS